MTFSLADTVQDHMSSTAAATSRSLGQQSTGQHDEDGGAERGKELRSSHVSELLS